MTKKAMEQYSGNWSRLLLKDIGSLKGKKEEEELEAVLHSWTPNKFKNYFVQQQFVFG